MRPVRMSTMRILVVEDDLKMAALLQRASSAALAYTGGGRVTEPEAGDEEGAYEVEVTRADGSQVDVHLDEDFNVLGTKADHEDDAEE